MTKPVSRHTKTEDDIQGSLVEVSSRQKLRERASVGGSVLDNVTFYLLPSGRFEASAMRDTFPKLHPSAKLEKVQQSSSIIIICLVPY